MEEIDRISDLPDCILHHILSFLDTKSSVRSSILSRKWRCVWKDVPFLTFIQDSVSSELGLEQQVNQVLSLRSEYCNVSNITTDFRISEKMDLFHRIMSYAASHGVERLTLFTHGFLDDGMLLETIVAVSTCYQSLKILALESVRFGETVFGLLSRLQQLNTLALTWCFFDGSYDGFAGFPKLESLKLTDCSQGSYSPFKISGAQLLNLEMRRICFNGIEIVAPKLQSFCVENVYYVPQDFSKLDLPCLNHACIDLLGNVDDYLDACDDDERDTLSPVTVERCVRLFNGLHNVKSLDLRFGSFELLTRTCNLVKHQPSPFKRMNFLRLQHLDEFSSLPYQVIRYYLEGSSNDEEKRFMVEKIRWWEN
ncbi:F-box/LRR-repeat protein 25 [Linum grandiflorum]